MRHSLRTAVLCVAALFALASPASAQGRVEERASLGIEATSLAFGIVALSPRIAVSVMVPLTGHWSIQASPAAAWGGETEDRYTEIDLPIALRSSLKLGPFIGFAAAGLELGWAHTSASTTRLGLGPIAEIGARLELFGRRVFVEPYLGAAAMAAFGGGEQAAFLPSAYGGLRLGYAF